MSKAMVQKPINRLTKIVLVFIFTGIAYLGLFNSCKKISKNTLGKDSTGNNSIPKDSLYQVWLDIAMMPQNAITQISTWSNTAKMISGIDDNTAPLTPVSGTISENESPILLNWNSFFPLIPQADSMALMEIPATHTTSSSAIQNVPSIPDFLTKQFNLVQKWGIQIRHIDIYNSGPYNWDPDSAQSIRNWLNANGHSEVKLSYNVRTLNGLDSAFVMNPIMDAIL